MDVYVNVNYAGAMSAPGTPTHGNTNGAVFFTISQLADEFGITARTLRHYEDQGIVSPRRSGQRRLYGRRDRARLRLALQGRRVGFTLAEIREMLDLYTLRDGQETHLRISLEKFRERVSRLKNQRREIDIVIAELQKTCTIVEAMLKTDAPTGDQA
ncbi:Predicted transcriptional regulator LiuR of leucine degradation pathway, MerR family [hydrothermal vent metagenome]|uniref:Predicted transcriptional regulator LiuR of leucine degradation pathway, MerR family n=1 Tax=hydrothermal vent metagenome TaxID=652676 RepID=A0A3B0T538_9ZZZZ